MRPISNKCARAAWVDMKNFACPAAGGRIERLLGQVVAITAAHTPQGAKWRSNGGFLRRQIGDHPSSNRTFTRPSHAKQFRCFEKRRLDIYWHVNMQAEPARQCCAVSQPQAYRFPNCRSRCAMRPGLKICCRLFAFPGCGHLVGCPTGRRETHRSPPGPSRRRRHPNAAVRLQDRNPNAWRLCRYNDEWWYYTPQTSRRNPRVARSA